MKKSYKPEETEARTIIGVVKEFLPKLHQVRTQHTVIEEFISTQVISVPGVAPGTIGQPQMEIIMSGVIIIEKPKQ